MAPKFRFGKNAIIRTAPVVAFATSGEATKPSASAFKLLCLAQDATIGIENTTIDIENFCTGGRTISVRDGGKNGTMSLGNTTWVEDDEAVLMMQEAAFAEDETGGLVYVEVLPLGAGVGKPVFDLVIDVRTWELSIPSKGVITVAHELSVLEGPIPGTLSA
jgi:chorismate synthase